MSINSFPPFYLLLQHTNWTYYNKRRACRIGHMSQCLLVCDRNVQDEKGKLSKLRKNENNIDVSLYDIKLPKLHENILKYNWLDVFKEIAIDFYYGSQTTSESPASILVQIGKCCLYPCLQFIFNLARGFVGILLILALRIIIEEIAILGVRQPDVRADSLVSPVCVGWNRVLMFQQSTSRSREALHLLITICSSLCWV